MFHAHPSLHSHLRVKRPSWIVILIVAVVLVIYTALLYFLFVSPFSFRWKAMFGDEKYPDKFNIHGIDISHHQSKIDWDELSQEAEVGGNPIVFAFIKATEGSNRFDNRFKDNYYQAKEHGLICGAYHFWSNKTSAKQQALFFINNVHLLPGDLPPVLDVEKFDARMTINHFRENILTWLEIIEEHYKVTPIIYASLNFKNKYLYGKAFDKYPYWIAHYYVKELGFAGNWKFWQHTDVGHLSGVEGFVDLNVYNGSYYDLKQLTLRDELLED